MTTALAIGPAAPISVESDDLYAHMTALGLFSISSYKLWCRRHGFSMDLDKSATAHLADLIKRIASGAFDGGFLAEPMVRVPPLFDEIDHVEDGRQALCRLLLHVGKYGRTQSHRNLVIAGLSQLALHHRHWVRPIQDWRPTTRKPNDQFRELATHLLARYPVPPCLHSSWFENDPQEAAIQQGWFLHVAQGNNIRTANDLPF